SEPGPSGSGWFGYFVTSAQRAAAPPVGDGRTPPPRSVVRELPPIHKLTRRQVAAALAGAAGLRAQTPASTAAAPPADELTAAREKLRQNARHLAQTPLPMAAEPAFLFKA
ncbi:MAG: hypothetical protein ABI165_17750, partial [Bryobacteraceae bacterium]